MYVLDKQLSGSDEAWLLGGVVDHFDSGEVNIKGLTEEQLVSLSVKDLNRICWDLPDDIIT